MHIRRGKSEIKITQTAVIHSHHIRSSNNIIQKFNIRFSCEQFYGDDSVELNTRSMRCIKLFQLSQTTSIIKSKAWIEQNRSWRGQLKGKIAQNSVAIVSMISTSNASKEGMSLLSCSFSPTRKISRKVKKLREQMNILKSLILTRMTCPGRRKINCKIIVWSFYLWWSNSALQKNQRNTVQDDSLQQNNIIIIHIWSNAHSINRKNES